MKYMASSGLLWSVVLRNAGRGRSDKDKGSWKT